MSYAQKQHLNASRGIHDTSMHYMYDMAGRPLYDVQGRPLMYGHQRAPTPQLPGQRDFKPRVKDPPTSTSFKVHFLPFYRFILFFDICSRTPICESILTKNIRTVKILIIHGWLIKQSK